MLPNQKHGRSEGVDTRVRKIQRKNTIKRSKNQKAQEMFAKYRGLLMVMITSVMIISQMSMQINQTEFSEEEIEETNGSMTDD